MSNTKLAIIEQVFKYLLQQPRWVEWRKEGDEKRKVPYIASTGRKASVADASSWRSFEACSTELRGLVFARDGLGGIDLDACRDPQSGVLAPWATEIIKRFNSYSEISPSGSGVKIFAFGAPFGFAKHVCTMPGTPIQGKRPQIELYADKRFFTVTGNWIPDTPCEIREATEAWAHLEQQCIRQGSKRSGKADEGRNGALYSLGCSLQAQGTSDSEISAAIREANIAGNVELHPNFASGPLPEREVAIIIRSVLKLPKGQTQDGLLARLNADYCVVQDGGKTRVLRFDEQVQMKLGKVVHRRLVPTFLSFGDFHNYFKNEHTFGPDGKPVALGNWWTGQPDRRTFLGLTFRPDLAETEVGGRLNLWRGWGIEPQEGDWSLLRLHIRQVIASDDTEADTYIMNWLAWTVQRPADRAEVALVLKGGRGVGKGTLGNALVRIFGQHATHISSADHLAGRFNSHLRDVCFLFADEAYWPGDKGAEGTLKRLITEPTLFIEAKGRDGVTVPNMLHVLMASNEDWIVPAGEHERRYAIFQVSEDKRQDRSWFKPLYDQLENGGYAAMLHDLLQSELGDWHPRNIPMTEALRSQQEKSMKPLDAWLLKFFEDGALPENYEVNRPDVALSRSRADVEGRNPRNGLYDLAREHPALKRTDDQVLAAHLKDWGCKPWRSNLARGWIFPPLAECRARWEEKYPDWPWQHPEMSDWQKEEKPEGRHPW